MKKLFIAMLAAAALAGCSKSESETPQVIAPAVPDLSAPISISAGVQTSTQSKAAISDAFFKDGKDVCRITAYAGTGVPSGSAWDATPYIANEQVNASGSNGTLAFENSQYYPADGTQKLYFYAYAPKDNVAYAPGASSNAPTATYTITGQEDILWAAVTSGIAKTPPITQPSFTFKHQLMQVTFKLVKDVSFEDSKTVTSIKITGVNTNAKMNLSTGVITWSGSDAAFTLPIVSDTKDEITAGGTIMDGCIMLQPNTSITLEVIADGVTYSGVPVNLSGDNAGKAGVSHEVTLTFKRDGVVPTATIDTWKTTGTGSTDIK